MQIARTIRRGAIHASCVDSNAPGSRGQLMPEEHSGLARIGEERIPRSILVKHQPAVTMVKGAALTERCVNRTTARAILDEAHFPAGHTFQPYFWISPLANEQFYADRFQPEERRAQVVAQLRMSKNRARQYFTEHFEYRLVDYGFSCTSEQPQALSSSKNYGLFARAPARSGEVLGVYSGVAYLLRTSSWWQDDRGWGLDTLQPAFYREMPDFMSCHRNLQAGVRGQRLNQRTTSKFSLEGSCADARYIVHIAPDNDRFTPMHFINSANTRADANAVIAFVPIATSEGQFTVPAFIAIRDIQVGEEILSDYLAPPHDDKKKFRVMSAAEEKLIHDRNIKSQLNLVRRLNCSAMARPISPFVAAPVIYVSEMVRKCCRQTPGKTMST